MYFHYMHARLVSGKIGVGRPEAGARCSALRAPPAHLLREPDDAPVTDHSPASVIAVVDDDSSILQSLEYLLESAGHTPLLFSSAAAMLASGCLPRIECMISDIDMPEMDGFELAQAVHAARPDLPVVLVTGHPELLDRLPPALARRFVVLRKPFDGQHLLTAISNVIANSRLQGPGR